jgi:zinc protease
MQEQTSAAQNYTFLFVGNYNDSTIRPLIEQYLASLPNRQELSQGPFINNWLKRDATCHFKRKMETPKTMVHLDWFTEAFPYTLDHYIKAQTACEILNLLYKNIIREENSATYGCYASYYMIRDDKDGCQIGFTAECEMKPEMCDSVLAMMKTIFSNMTKEIDETLFRNAKESLLKSYDELVKTANGFWLDTMWRKVSSGIDFYTDRRKLIEQLTPDELLSFMKVFQTHAHNSETLMQPE